MNEEIENVLNNLEKQNTVLKEEKGEEDMKKVTLNDIAGYESEKKEALKIIDFLKNYEDYTSNGIILPKGLLLTGAPGVGKTLFAKAICNEAGCKLIKFNNADDNAIENLKKYFAMAKESKPSVLFIDELDSLIGGSELPFFMHSDKEKEIIQTLLTEIDGVNSSEGILIVGTAMNIEHIDPALRRSGRLERIIQLPSPDNETRIKILDFYLSKHKIFDNISREIISKKIISFNGASIKRLVNEVLLEMKASHIEPSIGLFEEIIPSIAFNDIKRKNTNEELNYVIPHEIGHFLTNYVLNDDVASISVARYGNTAGNTRTENTKIILSNYINLKKELIILLGGIAAEEVINNSITQSGSSDIDRAYINIHEAMQTGILGFEYYLLDYDKTKGGLSEMILIPSEQKRVKIETKQYELITEAYSKAKQIIKDNLEVYEVLKEQFKDKDYLSSEQIKNLNIDKLIKKTEISF